MDAMPIPPELSRQPFTRTQACARGLSDQALRGSRFKRLFQGVYVCSGVPATFETYLRAAFLIVGDHARATHVTGLRYYGVEIGPMLPLRFASDRVHRSRGKSIRVIRRMRLALCNGPALRPEQCWVDACLDLDLVDAVTAAESLIHQKVTTLARLTQFVEATDNWEGIRKARLALPYVRAEVRSPRETVTRLLLVLAGLPDPDACNLDIYDGDEFIGCADLVWLAYAVVTEYDGRQHADDDLQWNHDIDRLSDFDDAGWRFVRVTNRRLRTPRETVRRVYNKLVEGGYTGPEPVFDEQWSRLFERRPAYKR